MSLAAGSKLGPYEILAPLGAGGMGEVWKATDARLDRAVALKVLPENFFEDKERVARFEREAKLLAALNHPNIAAIYSFEEIPGVSGSSGRHVLAQELLEGETLRSALGGGKLSPRKAIDYALQIAHGLAAAHEKGIVHRDLKPENLFGTKDGRVKILDFGLAKLTHTEAGPEVTSLPTATGGTEPGVVMGTLGYMSPEQVKGKPADARSDIFSFGAILYEMLSGQRAFHGDSAAETMSAILREEPPDLSVTNQSISPGLERIVRHCIEKNPEQRFHSAHDVAFALETAMGASSAPRVSAAPEKQRRPALRMALAVGAAAAALGLGLLLGGRLRPPSAPQFRRLTYHRGYIESARFSPDGQTVFFGSTRRDQALRIDSTRLDSVESRALDVPPGSTVLGISRTGEMALLLNCIRRGYWIRSGTLARVALGGGVPREILEHVTDADISPDGKDFAVVREVGRLQRLEFPVGKLILETDGWISHPRISPDGTRVAYLEHPGYGNDQGFVAVAPAGGTPRRVTGEWQGSQGLAWSRDGKEVWFGAGGVVSENGSRYQLWAVTPGEKSRLVYGPPMDLWLHDISSTGAVLFSRVDSRGDIGGFLKGDTKERDLSTWSDEAIGGMAQDGSAFTGIEQAAPGAGLEPLLYYRRAGEAAPVRLGVGTAAGMSPDGRWVASRTESGAALTLLPTGPGDPRPLPLGSVRLGATPRRISARWSLDGRLLLFSGSEKGRPARAWLLDLAGTGPPRAATPEGCSLAVLSPDGGSVATVDPEGKLLLCSVGGAPKDVRGALPGEIPLEWEVSGKALFLWDQTWPARVVRLELESGRRSVWKELAPDSTGLLYGNVTLTRDGRHYLYRLRRVLSELNVAEGLK
jgi:serine/threonine protein kinase/dipeptidyl aminopeptidase/acylaminoacyl peptidase